MTAQEARTHIRYSGWASRKLVDAAANLTPEQRTRHMGVSHESLQKTLAHIYFGDSVWYTRTVDTSRPVPNPDETPSIETLADSWSSLQTNWEKWADSISDADLQRIAHYKQRDGTPYESPVWQIVMHVVNHATLHRGQVMAMLRQLGAKPPATDLIYYYREKAAASGA
ncbi:MAG: DinB family protein [Bryobacterales bacterium]|nr:DinB family protein [Bryobacterales bacterium]MBV9402030.1 DinB family protein [Bryobacterales bacterium]